MKASQPLCHPHTQGLCPTPRSTPGPATGPTLVPTETPPQGDRTDLVTPALAGRGWNKHSALTRASARPPPLCQAAVLPQPAWPWGAPCIQGAEQRAVRQCTRDWVMGAQRGLRGRHGILPAESMSSSRASRSFSPVGPCAQTGRWHCS